MINYVNNSFDKVLKPCDAQQFMTLTQSSQTQRLILAHRAGEPKAKSKLPALTYMGVFDKDKYKVYLAQCEADGTKPQGSRRAEFMRPTGLLMLDFDHVHNQTQTPSNLPLYGEASQASRIDSPVKLWEYIVNVYDNVDLPLTEWVCLAHITPSGDGLRVVVKRTKGITIEQEQYEWCKAMKLDAIGIKPDAACKDISRLSFAPMQSEVLYYNPSLLFGELPEASDYPDGTIFGGAQTPSNLPEDPLHRDSQAMLLRGDKSPVVATNAHFALAPSMGRRQSPSQTNKVNTPEALPIEGEMPEGQRGSWGDLFNGIPYAEIVRRLEEQLGGRPEHGARNSFIFSMACNLRYICNDDAAWVASILPTYGEDPQKHRMTIQSAINRPMSRTMPETMARALRIAKLGADSVDSANSEFKIHNSELGAPPALPASQPEPLAMLLSRTPQPMRAAVAMAVFPPLGAHLHEATFHYWDNRDYEPTFMNVLVAELSSGKSAVNTPIEYIIADIEARDEVAREREREWKSQCATISNAKDKPQRPKGLAIQCLSADMTNAAFVQRLADAEGRFLYTQMDEIELLDSLKTNTRGGSVSAVLRLAFDCGKYGQERVASNAVNAKVRVRWNWNASTTVQRVRRYFAHSIADGTLSRLSFATILKSDEDWGDTYRPVYGDYGQAFADALHPYIDALCCCKGTLRCPEAEQWALSLSDELVDFARQLDDRTYATMSFRAVLMGFFRAMLLYVMNGCQWTTLIADFAAWSVRYDLWCKMRFFRDMLHKDMDGERAALQRGPVSLLTLLPTEFTRQQAEELRVAQGMKPNPKAMLSTWKKRGYVTLDEQRGVYVQTKRS